MIIRDHMFGEALEAEVLQTAFEHSARLWFGRIEKGLKNGVPHGAIGCLNNVLSCFEQADIQRAEKLGALNTERQARWGGV